MTISNPTAKNDKLNVPDNSNDKKADEKNSPEQNFVLSKREAKAASPDSIAVCGEEDPGEGLEFLVTDDRESKEED